MKVARQRYSDELKNDLSYEKNSGFHRDRRTRYASLFNRRGTCLFGAPFKRCRTQRDIMEKYLVDSDGYFAALNEPVVMFWLLYSDKVSTTVYREAWERKTEGHIK